MIPTATLIDVHHHAIPPGYRKALAADPIPGVDYPSGWSPESSLEVMDANGIAAAILSITAPGVHFAGPEHTPRLASEVNDYFAEVIQQYPTRFGAFAVLPLPDVDAARKELSRAVDTVGLDGVGLLTSYHNSYLGHPVFEPLFAELAERGIPVHVHPAVPPTPATETFGVPPSLYEFTFETTRTVVSLLFNGVLDRLPKLKLILSHAGGTLPFLARRLTYGPLNAAELANRPPADLIASLRRLYYDIAMSANEFALPSLTALADTDHVLFGTDYPFMPASHTPENVAGLAGFPGWNAEERTQIGHRNALRLFPELAMRIYRA
ncbi:amidohydrolase family protein [Kibdelosporangium aridum]|uniref:amidohydrolase family protein n=1 Tax=Kibdelosporangium aridum TaxID=2030 RepID=UPI000527EDEB